MCAALRPRAIDRFAIRRNRSFERSIHRRNFKVKGRSCLFQRTGFDAVDALIEAVDRRNSGAVLRHTDVQNEMQNVVAGLQRTGPVPGQRLTLRRSWSLRSCVSLRGGWRSNLRHSDARRCERNRNRQCDGSKRSTTPFPSHSHSHQKQKGSERSTHHKDRWHEDGKEWKRKIIRLRSHDPAPNKKAARLSVPLQIRPFAPKTSKPKPAATSSCSSPHSPA